MQFLKQMSIFMLILIFYSFSLSAQDCLPDGITLTSQSEVNSFPILYPDCTTIGGDLRIESGAITSTITDLTPLSKIKQINGDLIISNNTILLNLDGLDSIQSINGNLEVSQNFSLQSITGLAALEGMVGDIILDLNAELEDLSSLEKIDSMTGTFQLTNHMNLRHLDGLNNLRGGSRIIINTNFGLETIKGLNGLNTAMESIDISDNDDLEEVSGFNSIPACNGPLLFSNNMERLNGFDGLQSLGSLSFSRVRNIVEINGFNNIIELDNLELEDCTRLERVQGLSNLRKVNNSISIEMMSSLVDLSGLSNIDSVGGRYDLQMVDKLENVDMLQSLIYVGDQLEIFMCSSISNLSGIKDGISAPRLRFEQLAGLTSLESITNKDFSNVDKLDIGFNPNLTYCAVKSICDLLINRPNDIFIAQNGENCRNSNEIIEICKEKNGNFSAVVFYDENQNKIFDPNESILSGIKITNAQLNIDYLSIANQVINAEAPIGNYIIVYDRTKNQKWRLTTDSSEYNICLGENTPIDTIYFGLFPIEDLSQQISTISATPSRCNDQMELIVQTSNLGTLKNNGTLWLKIDDNITNFTPENEPDQFIGNQQIGWNYGELVPGQAVDQKVTITIPGTPTLTPGDQITFETFASFEDDNGIQVTDTLEYRTIIACNYLSNDKLVNPNRSSTFDKNYTLFEEDLTYTIRFQNTGNAEASDVVILDTLDDNLNVETFQVLATSHPEVLSTSITEGKYISFDFKNIFLPDSTSDFEGSQGYVTFLIEPFNGLAENTSITNSASIYFDQNPPIHTNTTENVMVSELPKSVSAFALETKTGFSVFPNPTSDVIRIEAERFGDYRFEVLDLTGRRLTTGFFQQTTFIDLDYLGSGIYLLSVFAEDGAWTTKLIKQ